MTADLRCRFRAPARVAFIIVCALAAAILPATVRAAESYTLVYLGREADRAYEPAKAYTGLILRDRKRPLDGARVGLRESRVMGRALGLKFALEERMLTPSQDAADAVREIAAATGASVFLLDLPLEELTAAAAALAAEPYILFNVRHGDDFLRGAACAPGLFHTLPSDAMVMDALAQYLKHKNWGNILILQGEEAGDARIAKAFQASAKKFGLKIVAVRPFKLSNDPRIRDQNNIRLLTAVRGYDVVFLADTHGEFGRYVPFQTLLPRPVVGTEGLIADAWHWTWERHGAPQLNQRFRKRADYHMTGTQWAAWAAVRAVVEAILRHEPADGATPDTRLPDAKALRTFLTSDRINLDLYKGNPGSFRPWDRQLRQTILLHTHNAVVARAPIEGFLHQTNNLDTLGTDQATSACRY